MKLHILDRSIKENRSVSVRNNVFPYFLKLWHNHVELELVYVIKCSGTRFIDDSIEKFDKGDLVLIGKDLPHLWLNDKVYFNPNSTLLAEAIGIHFREDFLGETIFTAPEMLHIGKLDKLARRGILFYDISPKLVADIEDLLQLEGFEKK